MIAPQRLNRRAQERLSRREQVFFPSAASSWEIAIEYALGKLRVPDPPARWVPAAMLRLRAHPLGIVHRHALEVADVPSVHQDPFDRVLIEQAESEDLTLLTADRIFEKYPVQVFHCGP